jgi:hypothetical protein
LPGEFQFGHQALSYNRLLARMEVAGIQVKEPVFYLVVAYDDGRLASC